MNVAVTLFAAFMVTTQVSAVPVQPPDQPLNTDPLLGAAVSVTLVLSLKLVLQKEPQMTPAGLLVTGPLPVPALPTVKMGPAWLKWALTPLAAVMLTTQVEVPLQAPDQPANTDPLLAVAVNVTLVPEA